MIRYGVSVDIAAAPDRVFAVMSDAERWPEWTRSVRRVRQPDPGAPDVGTRVKIWQPGYPPTVWRMTGFEPGRGFTWVASGPGSLVHARHCVEPIAGGSRASLSISYEKWLALLVGRLTRATNERYLKMEADGLKARSENPTGRA